MRKDRTDVVAAMKEANWNQARRLLRLRLEMRHAPTREDRATIERILRAIDEAEARGIGPEP